MTRPVGTWLTRRTAEGTGPRELPALDGLTLGHRALVDRPAAYSNCCVRGVPVRSVLVMCLRRLGGEDRSRVVVDQQRRGELGDQRAQLGVLVGAPAVEQLSEPVAACRLLPAGYQLALVRQRWLPGLSVSV
jgi:hypothetical protein